MRSTVGPLALLAASLGVILLAANGWGNAAQATHAMPCADINGDGVVDYLDVDIVTSWFFTTVPPAPASLDVVPNGVINLADITATVNAFGTATFCQDKALVHGKPPFPGGQGDDTMPSLGTFRILVAAPFRPLMAGYPGYDGVSRLTSPVMSDSATKVGRSAVHTDGSAADTSGTAVGTAGTLISDSTFSLIPPGFQGPAGVREIHTELRTLNLTGGGAAVRAGTAAPSRPISPGEVESSSASGMSADDWPAQSFFDVFVEVDLPALAGFPGGTLYNSGALLVESPVLERFPPRVVYYHGNSSAVAVYFKTANPGFWQAGDLFGDLVLAGHGASYAADPTMVPRFQAAVATIEQARGEIPLPVGGVAQLPQPLAMTSTEGPSTAVIATLAAVVLLALFCAAWWVRRRARGAR